MEDQIKCLLGKQIDSPAEGTSLGKYTDYVLTCTIFADSSEFRSTSSRQWMLPLDPMGISTADGGQGHLSSICHGTAKTITINSWRNLFVSIVLSSSGCQRHCISPSPDILNCPAFQLSLPHIWSILSSLWGYNNVDYLDTCTVSGIVSYVM